MVRLMSLLRWISARQWTASRSQRHFDKPSCLHAPDALCLRHELVPRRVCDLDWSEAFRGIGILEGSVHLLVQLHLLFGVSFPLFWNLHKSLSRIQKSIGELWLIPNESAIKLMNIIEHLIEDSSHLDAGSVLPSSLHSQLVLCRVICRFLSLIVLAAITRSFSFWAVGGKLAELPTIDH